ncbi:PIR Superfamily Protein [Plasmodium ovale wallikeri]|uniref:PIR Superfamily Protein n=1 Tax=Plasmodium ovale wallikeri TaxID=864142 RepID=A0A1A9AGU1_PLAOA|nr:PIR Superfamily Protein [Plasmodium ovale wallikeri]SBT55410.1 PIR Superfamily Protein [Plasmodium ovale wallikeri]
MSDEIKALKDIDSLIFDYELDNIKGKCVHCSSCYNYGKNLSNPFFFHLLCQRLVKNIEFIHLAYGINRKYSDEKSCNDFIYWIHNNVNNMKDKINESEINNIFSELKIIWNEVNGKLKDNDKEPLRSCDISKLNTLNFDELKKNKLMADYCQNFELLHLKLTFGNKPHCKDYYDYFMKTKKAYEDVLKECHKQGIGTKCPKICIRKQNNNPQLILKNLRCDEIPKPVEEEKHITEKQCNTEKGVLQSQLERALLDASNPVFNYSDPRAVFLILSTFWGIFLTLFSLYKITPFGVWIRNKLLRKKLTEDNFDEAVDDESIYDYSGSMNTNMQNLEYNISYNSDWSPSQ